MSQRSESSSSQPPAKVHSVGPVGPDGVVRCFHNQPAVERISHTSDNPERAFYTCNVYRDDSERCSFFRWADSLGFPQNTPIPTASSTPDASINIQSYPPSSPSTPYISRRSPVSASRPRKSLASTKSTPEGLAKRNATIAAIVNQMHSSPTTIVPQAEDIISTPSTPFPSSSEKLIKTQHTGKRSDEGHDTRLAAIRAALSPVPSATTPPADEAGGKHAAVQTDLLDWESTTEETADEDDAFGPTSANNPSVGHVSDIEESDAQEPPRKKFCFIRSTVSTPSRGGAGQSAFGPDSPEKSNTTMTLPTPPHEGPLPRVDNSVGVGGSGSSMTADGTIGKEPKQWPQIRDDPENPFYATARNLFPRAEQSPAQGQPSGQPPPPTKSSAESVTSAMAILSGIPDEIRKLERKLAASEQSQKYKTKRIVDLEKEVQGLKDQIRVLEETVGAYNARR